MCGIAGILHEGRLQDAERRARRMAAAMPHRGPDDQGFWSDREIALGFVRLSILDVAGGAQPMSNEDGTVFAVYNGEIYNHRELRRALEARGHRFKTDHCDTEVLVHGWEEWGERLASKLNGMFAFAVWDCRRRSLYLARDRFGIKPLYWARSRAGDFVFSSEIRPLLASGLVDKKDSPAGLLEYLSFQNNWAGRTPFDGIFMLPAGTYELIEGGREVKERYWALSFPRRRALSLGEAANEYRFRLLDVLRRQMDADVPITTYLSGGIDSTAVTAAAHVLDRSVRAYSCIFDLSGVGADAVHDEREFSRAAAAFLGIDRVEYQVSQTALEDNLDPTIRALEYPRMGMSYVNNLIAGRVAKDAKVVLSGTGGDEVNGGYVGRYHVVPRGGSAKVGWRTRLTRLFHPARALHADPLEVYRNVLNFLIPESELSEALTTEFRIAAQGFSARAEIDAQISACPSRDLWDIVMFVDANTYLHGLLVLEDKLSMSHSLETRVPLLDNELVDALLDLDWSLLCDGDTGKVAFREAVKPWVPNTIYTKPKMGFGPPDASWYRGPLKGWIEQRLGAERIEARGLFISNYVRRKLDEHFSGRVNNVAFIWSMLSLESWFEQFGMFGGAINSPERTGGTAYQMEG
jgi:asparagine synthase (glutamine-hydrolysing)